VFAFDPSLNLEIQEAVINQVTLSIPWEQLGPGPSGECLEVVDLDPPSKLFYPPVNLDEPHLLVQDGLPPSEGSPQFHQQMVYAVAMKTIQNFETALGRKVLWATHQDADGREKFVKRLRIYPHALRQANAFYSPAKKALLFGYFPASRKNAGRNLPGGTVFTCLAHDIIAHEVTHALLDGIHPYFGEPSNPDALALHEAFADLVALFQRFSYPEVLRHTIAKTRGDLASDNLLARLAQQFGEATGKRGALRSAIGAAPDVAALQNTHEPHARGAILVAAVFDAFLTVYQHRSADLLRIASGGTGILQAGALHPDLVWRLADEAAQTAHHLLFMCIRALDYCPPVDINFGEYLRALITADLDHNPEDAYGYRIALIESFRKRGIYPPNVRNLSQESLVWTQPEDDELLARIFDFEFQKLVRERQLVFTRLQQRRETLFASDLKLREDIKRRLLQAIDLQGPETGQPERELPQPRSLQPAAALSALERSLNFKLPPDPARRSIFTERAQSRSTGEPVELAECVINSVRIAQRVDGNGQHRDDLVVEISQRRRGYFDPEQQQQVDSGEDEASDEDFIFRGGSTMLIDLDTGRVRYVISKSVASNRRLEIQRNYLEEADLSLAYTYFGSPQENYFRGGGTTEPFAMLHGSSIEDE
jgi:hypothetical protein